MSDVLAVWPGVSRYPSPLATKVPAPRYVSRRRQTFTNGRSARRQCATGCIATGWNPLTPTCDSTTVSTGARRTVVTQGNGVWTGGSKSQHRCHAQPTLVDDFHRQSRSLCHRLDLEIPQNRAHNQSLNWHHPTARQSRSCTRSVPVL